MALDKVLFVDDEKNILDALKRQLYKIFNISIALSGDDALNIMEKEGPPFVVVSDMSMPGMDGIQFLAKVKEKYPDTIRIMLTGHADIDTAIASVNEGNIFRFLTKPCSQEIIVKVLGSALKQYHLLMAERELLEKTLNGSIKVLIEILSLINPIAFSHTNKIKYFVVEISKLLQLQDIWRFEVSALLSQIGCVTIPSEVLEKIYCMKDLSPDEQEMVKAFPHIGSELIKNIPRLESIAEIIARQKYNFDNTKPPDDPDKSYIEIGSQILRIAIDYEYQLSSGNSKKDAIESLYNNHYLYNPKILSVLDKINLPKAEKKIIKVNLTELSKGMSLEEDIMTKSGVLLVKKGQEITPTMGSMLNNYYRQGNMKKDILVSIF
ncbi:response regulator [Candidatus Desantisbacteria bacterium]|nr:response regulator [Candidatus Desantisbacteria bacterium]